MLAFRSEEHVERWCREHRVPRGAVFPAEKAWALARGWYADRLDPGWRRRTPEEGREIFEAAGLTGQFWSLV